MNFAGEKLCDRSDCTMPGLWHPVLMLPMEFPHRKPGTDHPIQLGMVVCALHKDILGPNDFIVDDNPRGWNMLAQSVKTLTGHWPDRSKVYLKWIVVGSEEDIMGKIQEQKKKRR
jgi:hypothetical protein